MNDLDRYVPILGEPGNRFDPETGQRYYSSAWLSDPSDAPLAPQPYPPAVQLAAVCVLDAIPTAAAVPRELLEPPVPAVAVVRLDGTELLRDPEAAKVLQLQRRTLPDDLDIGPIGAARRAEPRGPSRNRIAPPEALDLTERNTLRRLVLDGLDAAIRNADRLADAQDDKMDVEIIRGRRRQIQVVRALFEDDTHETREET